MNHSVENLFGAFLITSVFLIAAYAIKKIIFTDLILPASLLAGSLALIFGPE